MSADKLRDKANRLYTKARFMTLLGMCAGLVVGALFAFTVIRVHGLVPRLGWGLISLWAIYLAYQTYRWNWPAALPEGAPVSASLEFYRSKLEKRRDHLRNLWLRTRLPFCFLGLAMVIGPGLIAALQRPHILVNAVPFFVLLIGWFVAFFTMKKRQQRTLQQEHDELRAFEKANRA